MNWNYYKRICQAYLSTKGSHLSFWHETPSVNSAAFTDGSDQYFMTFLDKTCYIGPFDYSGVPMLDYRGTIGCQYNPIAIAQYGLGCFNRFRNEGDTSWLTRARSSADWLVDNLEQNKNKHWVWMHRFDWEYYKKLKAPWYSGLAQGQGISLLVRMAKACREHIYADAARSAFRAMTVPVDEGGTLFVDDAGNCWIEEYITDPVTHILNGMIWALWGVYDFAIFTNDIYAYDLWQRGLVTLRNGLGRFDCGFWSLYDLAPLTKKNLASSFYHQLHIVQMDIMFQLSGLPLFKVYQKQWTTYQATWIYRQRAFLNKVAFKLIFY